MPYIGTSSDQYQHRDPALTTYRKNRAAPTLREAMAERSEDKAKAAAVERRQVHGRGSSADKVAVDARPAAVAARQKDPVDAAKAAQDLYAPASRPGRVHDDRRSVVTGGRVDVRA